MDYETSTKKMKLWLQLKKDVYDRLFHQLSNQTEQDVVFKELPSNLSQFSALIIDVILEAVTQHLSAIDSKKLIDQIVDQWVDSDEYARLMESDAVHDLKHTLASIDYLVATAMDILSNSQIKQAVLF